MNRPTISINFAISADGKITSVAGRPSGWTSREDFERLKRLREGADAIMVGRQTLEADQMTMKAPGDPLRCVASRRGNFNFDHPLFHSQGGDIHLLSAEPPSNPPHGVTLHQGTLAEFLNDLHTTHHINHLHCEGGGELVRELAKLDAIDQVHLTWAGHRLFGGRDAPGISGLPGSFLPASRSFELVHFEPLEASGECFLSYERKRCAE